jgi:Tc toxin complex TcA C-terminal TcB-binding domain/Neuraminidase-like domain/Salmonella virulence plasmid 28.1kDa A protein
MNADELRELHGSLAMSPRELARAHPELFAKLTRDAERRWRAARRATDGGRVPPAAASATSTRSTAGGDDEPSLARVLSALEDEPSPVAARDGTFRRLQRLGASHSFAPRRNVDTPLRDHPLFQAEVALAQLHTVGAAARLGADRLRRLAAKGWRLSTFDGRALATLVATDELSEADGAALARAVALYGLADGDPALLRALGAASAPPNGGRRPGDLQDLAALDSGDWERRLGEASISPPRGQTVRDYARALADRIAARHPSATLFARLRRLPTPELGEALARLQPILGDDTATRFEGGPLDPALLAGRPPEEARALEATYAAVAGLVRRHPGLGLGEVLRDRARSPSAQAAEIEARIGWLDSIRVRNPEVEWVALDYTPGSADVAALDLSDLPDRARGPVLATLKAYQRAYALAGNAPDAAALIEGGYHSASRVVQDRPERIQAATGLGAAETSRAYTRAQYTIGSVATATGAVLDLARGGFVDIQLENLPPALEEHLRRLPGYAELFGSQSTCRCAHCQSILSPAAYFVDLMSFVEENVLARYFTGAKVAHGLNLKVRRPDLWTLPLTCANTVTELPTLDVINEALENEVARRRGFPGSLADRGAVEQRVYEQTLAGSASSFRQPFVLPLARLDIYLRHFERTRDAVARALDAPVVAIVTGRLGLSRREHDLVTVPNVALAFLHSLYGIPFHVPAGGTVDPVDVHELVRGTGIDREELGLLLDTRFVTRNGAEPIQVRLEKASAQSVQNDAERVYGLTSGALDRLHRFARLRRSLRWKPAGATEERGWSSPELDLVLSQLADAGLGADLTAAALGRLVAVLDVQARFGLSVEELCPLFGAIPVRALAPDRDSLFDRLFNLPSFVRLDGRFPKNATRFVHPGVRRAGPPPADPALPRLLAGLRVTDEQLLRLITHLAGPLGADLGSANEQDRGVPLSVANLSLLYRHARLAEALGTSVDELFQLLTLLPGLPQPHVGTLGDLSTLIDWHDWWRTSGYTLDDLGFVTGGPVRAPGSYPDRQAIADQLIAEIGAERALSFADTVFAAVEGVTETESRRLITANGPAIEPLPDGGGYRLAAGFDPAAALVIPVGATITEPQAKAVLLRYHASEVLPSRLAGALGLSVDKVRALLEMVGADLAAAPLVQALHGGAPGPLRDLVGTILPLGVLFRSPVYDAAALGWIRGTAAGVANGGMFGLADFRAVSLDSLRRLSVYRMLADPGEAGRFSRRAQPVEATDVRAALTGFVAGQGFDLSDADPARQQDKRLRLGRVLRADPALVTALNARLAWPATAPAALLRLARAVALCQHLGVSGDVLHLLVAEAYGDLAKAADAVLSSIRARAASESAWQERIGPFEDLIRSRKRDALVEYLTRTAPEFRTPDDLYHYLLVDVKLEGCARTSRVAAAIASVQLYVHRCILNLEQDDLDPADPQHVHVQLADTAADEWAWRKNYRVWEANRKVFLFPENYLEPELRDDKTPLFEALESTLLQQEITEQHVLDAYATYLTGFEQLARLRIAGAYHERTADPDVLHLFGVTADDPPVYWYRTVENLTEGARPDGNGQGAVWSPWRKLDVQISGRTVAPVVHRGRLHLFWVESVTSPTSAVDGGDARFSGYRHKLTLKLTTLRGDGTWTAPQSVAWPATDPAPPPDPDRRAPESAGFPFRGDAGVVPDPLEDPGEQGDLALTPRYAVEPHRAPRDGYGLNGPLWDQVYLEVWPDELVLMGANFRVFQSVDFHRRTLRWFRGPIWDSAVERTVHSRPARLRGSGPPPVRELYRGAPANRGLPFLMLGHAFSSLMLEHERLALWGHLRNGPGDTTPDLVADWLGITRPADPSTGALKIADLPPGAQLVSINSSRPVADFLIDADGDLLLLQGSVRPRPGFRLTRAGTTLAEAVGEALFVGGVDRLLGLDFQASLREAPTPIAVVADIEDGVNADTLDFRGPYGVYFRELFHHIPFLIANHLNSQQRFAAARRWYHYLFDPTTTEAIPAGLAPADRRDRERDRPWRYLEFRGLGVPVLRTILTDPDAIAAYRKDPFNPHAIARLRLSAYQKAVVMKYIDNLLDWGDSLFAQFTRESVNEATALYVLAADILGERPAELGACGEAPGLSYERIAPLIRPGPEFLGDEFLIEMETLLLSRNRSITGRRSSAAAPFVDAFAPDGRNGAPVALGPARAAGADAAPFDAFGWSRTHTGTWSMRASGSWRKGDVVHTPDHGGLLPGDPGWAPDFGWSLIRQIVPVFCFPANGELLEYWNRVEDRLEKIRQCRDLAGVRRDLALFAPEIDPRLLVRARAAGISLEEVLNATSGDLPPYRFVYLIERAKSYAGVVQAFGAALMAALEKKDAEELARLRIVHEQNVQKLARQVRQREADAATEEIAALERQQATVAYRKTHYQNLMDEDLIPWERIEGRSRHAAGLIRGTEATLGYLAGALHLLPQLGSPFALKYGGQDTGNSAHRLAVATGTLAAILDSIASSAGLEAGHQRRHEEWQHQVRLADHELRQLDRQLAVARLRQEIATRALETHDRSVAQQEEIFDFFGDKFSSLGLYTWLAATLQRLYREAYNGAYAMATLAERAFKFERGDDGTVLIGRDSWDASRAGLLAGERLLLDVQSLERRFVETNYRAFEVTQSFALSQIDPAALLQLRETGGCTFAIPEVFFDLAYPGQYRRLIRAVRLSVPCVTGPFTNVSATLTLTHSEVRVAPQLGPASVRSLAPRRSVSIATTTAQNDAGVFELSFRDERYMPFEGAGAVSTWDLALPRAFPAFDYQTITDVVLHVSYVAEFETALRDLVEAQNAAAVGTILQALANQRLGRIVSLRQDFSGEFHQLLHRPLDTPARMTLTDRHFPFFLRGRALEITGARLLLKTRGVADVGPLQLTFDGGVLPGFAADPNLPGVWSTAVGALAGQSPRRPLTLAVRDAGDLAPPARVGDPSALDADRLLDVLLQLEYKLAPAP